MGDVNDGSAWSSSQSKILCSGEVKVSILTWDQNQNYTNETPEFYARYTNTLLQVLISLYYKQAFSAIKRYLCFKLATELSNSCTNCWTAWPADDRLCPSRNIRDHSHHLVLSLYLMISQIQCHPNKNKNNPSDFQNITEHSRHLTQKWCTKTARQFRQVFESNCSMFKLLPTPISWLNDWQGFSHKKNT